MSAVLALSDEQMYERMVCAILDHKLPPGTKLVEDKLASAFGVSRTRVRPVLVRLANEQIVTLTPNRGAAVAQPTVKEAHEVFQVRRMIEPTLVEMFIAAAHQADMDALAQCIEEEEAERAGGDTRRAIRLAGDFHLHIAQVAGHQTLGRILRELVSRTSLILMTYGDNGAGVTRCGCRDHRALLNAVRLRDAKEAGHIMREHLSGLESRLRFAPPADDDAPDLARLFGIAA